MLNFSRLFDVPIPGSFFEIFESMHKTDLCREVSILDKISALFMRRHYVGDTYIAQLRFSGSLTKEMIKKKHYP
jgi:hypothetical protein